MVQCSSPTGGSTKVGLDSFKSPQVPPTLAVSSTYVVQPSAPLVCP